ncbi:MAG: GNAT family N-acetyltransferase [Candidatus Thermoplasmatota archaeon]
MPLTVRRATRADMPRLVVLLQELAAFEKLAGPTPDAEARLAADLGKRYDALLAEDAGIAVGYAIVFETYSTFLAKSVLYLEDLFVTQKARRRGVARLLMHEVAREATARGCPRVSWVVLDWNTDAQEFYRKLGAKRSAWDSFSLDGDALSAVARLGASP